MKWFFPLSLPLFGLDQLTKHLTVVHFEHPETGLMKPVTVIEGFFDLVRVHNTGIAFGRFNGSAYGNLVFGVIAFAALVAIIAIWWKEGFPTRLAKTAAALLISGILGNLIDRLTRGYVVDFLHFDLGFMIWPSFNIADSCICIAAGLLMIATFQKTPTLGQPEGSTCGPPRSPTE